MEKFLTNLKREAEANPLMAMGVATALLAAVSRFIDASGHAVGRRAYAKQVKHRTQKSK